MTASAATPPPEGPRDRAQRQRDALAKLRQRHVDVWVASASVGSDGAAGEPYLVPLSLAWVEERVVVALPADSRTARNITTSGRARLGLGPTRDVVVVDVRHERTVAVTDPEAADIGEGYAAQADWDPRDAGPGYAFLVLRPERVQAWREADELPGRTLMRHGRWLEPEAPG